MIRDFALLADELVVFTIRESAFEDEECNEEDADTNHAIFEVRRAFLVVQDTSDA